MAVSSGSPARPTSESGERTWSTRASTRARRAPSDVEQRCRAAGSCPGAAVQEAVAPSVLVVFADQAGCPWLRPLGRGFRHCFAALRAGSVWLACDPLKDRIELHALELPGNFDLAGFYCAQGHRVLMGERPPPRARRRFALAPLTCVTVVKRLLAIDAPWVWTPRQLYTHLSGPEHGFRAWPGPTSPAAPLGAQPRRELSS